VKITLQKTIEYLAAFDIYILDILIV